MQSKDDGAGRLTPVREEGTAMRRLHLPKGCRYF